jgi:2-polyprenyl-3-methyl-5-hydroxy-6-metoxy-1,4-benzoquinol methylase
VYGYPYVRCLNCSHIYCQTPAAARFLEGLYSGRAKERCIQNLVYLDESIFNQRIGQIARPKVEFINNILAGRGLWVDVGCGAGEILIAAKETGWRVKGIETDKNEAAFARSRGLKVIGSALTVKTVERYLKGANLVSLINILEHLKQPCLLLVAIARSIPRDSHIVMEVPRHPSISSFCAQAFPDLAARHLYPPNHLHVFSERSAALLLERAGLKLIAIWNFGQDFYALAALAAAKAGLRQKGFYQEIEAASSNIQYTLDRQGFSDTMLLVCRKI